MVDHDLILYCYNCFCFSRQDDPGDLKDLLFNVTKYVAEKHERKRLLSESFLSGIEVAHRHPNSTTGSLSRYWQWRKLKCGKTLVLELELNDVTDPQRQMRREVKFRGEICEVTESSPLCRLCGSFDTDRLNHKRVEFLKVSKWLKMHFGNNYAIESRPREELFLRRDPSVTGWLRNTLKPTPIRNEPQENPLVLLLGPADPEVVHVWKYYQKELQSFVSANQHRSSEIVCVLDVPEGNPFYQRSDLIPQGCSNLVVTILTACNIEHFMGTCVVFRFTTTKSEN